MVRKSSYSEKGDSSEVRSSADYSSYLYCLHCADTRCTLETNLESRRCLGLQSDHRAKGCQKPFPGWQQPHTRILLALSQASELTTGLSTQIEDTFGFLLGKLRYIYHLATQQ